MHKSTAQILMEKSLNNAIKTHEEQSFRAKENKIWQNDIENILVDFGYTHIIQSLVCIFWKTKSSIQKHKKREQSFYHLT